MFLLSAVLNSCTDIGVKCAKIYPTRTITQKHYKRMPGLPIFLSCLCPRSRSHDSQGQIFIEQFEGLVTNVIVCDYQKIHQGMTKLWTKFKFLHKKWQFSQPSMSKVKVIWRSRSDFYSALWWYCHKGCCVQVSTKSIKEAKNQFAEMLIWWPCTKIVQVMSWGQMWPHPGIICCLTLRRLCIRKH